jgi:uncharacterized protein YajQ (UPF0234 family)
VVDQPAQFGIAVRTRTSVCATAGKPKLLSVRRFTPFSIGRSGMAMPCMRTILAQARDPLARQAMPSFDAVLEPNFVELRNAVEQVNKEIGTRFDFKGSSAKVDLTEKGTARDLMLCADSDFQISQVKDILLAKLPSAASTCAFSTTARRSRRSAATRSPAGQGEGAGVDAELGKKIQQAVKQSKIKVQAAIQGDIVRVTGAKRDDLQLTIALLRREIADTPIRFDNPRD